MIASISNEALFRYVSFIFSKPNFFYFDNYVIDKSVIAFPSYLLPFAKAFPFSAFFLIPKGQENQGPEERRSSR